MAERVRVRGRGVTLVLSTTRRMTDEEYGYVSRALEASLRSQRRPRCLVLDGLRLDGVIPDVTSGRARGGYRPRWAR